MICNDKTVQIVAIAGLTTLGVVCIVVPGDVATMLAIAIAGMLGLLAPSIFPRRPTDAEEV
jgi:hypothetical protein